MADETQVTAAFYMDRGHPLGNSEDRDTRRALHVLVKNPDDEPIPVSVTIPSPQGKQSIALIRNDYSITPVTTAAYVQLLASTTDTINQIQIFDSSGQTLYLAVGPAASEVNQIFIFPGGNGTVDLLIPSGSRISVKAITATANVGELDIICLK